VKEVEKIFYDMECNDDKKTCDYLGNLEKGILGESNLIVADYAAKFEKLSKHYPYYQGEIGSTMKIIELGLHTTKGNNLEVRVGISFTQLCPLGMEVTIKECDHPSHCAIKCVKKKVTCFNYHWLSINHAIVNYLDKTIVFGTHIVGKDEIQNYQSSYENTQAYTMLSSLKVEKSVVISDVRVVRQFLEVFLEDVNNLPLDRDIEFFIDLVSSTGPMSIAPYRMSLIMCFLVGVPILLMQKKDEDYHQLNKVMIKNRYPPPRINDVMDQLVGTYMFSKIDLSLSYHQICVKCEDILKTTFRTYHDHYKYMVMPFALVHIHINVTNALDEFMDYMNRFHLYLDSLVVIFVDDIILYSKTREENIEHLRVVFQVFKDKQLYVKMS
ncbi:hypothetical protein CR513_42275, partial [Mucuna pruriens]